MTAAVGFLLFLAFVLTCIVVVGWVGAWTVRRYVRWARQDRTKAASSTASWRWDRVVCTDRGEAKTAARKR